MEGISYLIKPLNLCTLVPLMMVFEYQLCSQIMIDFKATSITRLLNELFYFYNDWESETDHVHNW